MQPGRLQPRAAPGLPSGATAVVVLWCLLWLAAWWRGGLPVLAIGGMATLPLAALLLLLLRAERRQAALLAALHHESARRDAAELALRQHHRMASIGRLTRGLAHDFNNHLTAVNSNIELLLRRLPPDADRLSKLAEAAIDGVRRAALLTHQLLSLSRKQPVDPEPLDIGRLVAEMADLLDRALGKGITVETRLADGLWLAWADARQVEWSLLEMALNARDALPRGGTLSIQTMNVPAGQAGATAEHHDCVVLAVSDTREADAELPAQWTGEPVTGGQVRISRQESRGATVWLYLPRYLIQPVATECAEAGGAEAHRPGTILLVEDDEDIRGATAATLREMGYRVLEAPDAMEGFRLIVDRGGIDLLFTDIGLPAGVDGRALADAARNLVPELRILFTTGSLSADHAGAASSERSVLFLPKPFTQDQLAAKVREALPATAAAPELATGAG